MDSFLGFWFHLNSEVIYIFENLWIFFIKDEWRKYYIFAFLKKKTVREFGADFSILDDFLGTAFIQTISLCLSIVEI